MIKYYLVFAGEFKHLDYFEKCCSKLVGIEPVSLNDDFIILSSSLPDYNEALIVFDSLTAGFKKAKFPLWFGTVLSAKDIDEERTIEEEVDAYMKELEKRL